MLETKLARAFILEGFIFRGENDIIWEIYFWVILLFSSKFFVTMTIFWLKTTKKI